LPSVSNELEALGMTRGEKFEQIVEQVFAIQLTGRGAATEVRSTPRTFVPLRGCT
jgi:hypothetical protein